MPAGAFLSLQGTLALHVSSKPTTLAGSNILCDGANFTWNASAGTLTYDGPSILFNFFVSHDTSCPVPNTLRMSIKLMNESSALTLSQVTAEPQTSSGIQQLCLSRNDVLSIEIVSDLTCLVNLTSFRFLVSQ